MKINKRMHLGGIHAGYIVTQDMTMMLLKIFGWIHCVQLRSQSMQ